MPALPRTSSFEQALMLSAVITCESGMQYCIGRSCEDVTAAASAAFADDDQVDEVTFSRLMSFDFQPAMTRLCLLAARCARVMPQSCPSRYREGAGKAGYPLIPMVRVQQKSTRQNHRFS